VALWEGNQLDLLLMTDVEAHVNAVPWQVDPGNAQLLDQHLTCAAVEAPLLPADDAYFGPGLGAAISRLLGKSALPAYA